MEPPSEYELSIGRNPDGNIVEALYRDEGNIGHDADPKLR
jgi:hypothetical protein